MLCEWQGQAAGCAGLKKIDSDICEMKRLYVRPAFRKKGIGKKLTLEIINEARIIGYKYMRLDTLVSMQEAVQLYESLGFKYIAPYRYNPLPGALYLELNLDAKIKKT